MNEQFLEFFRRHLTKRELESLYDALKDYGDIEDLVLYAVRRLIDPDLMSVSELQMCVKKAVEIASLVPSSSGTVADVSQYYKIAEDVARQAESVPTQQNNPLKPLFDAMMQRMMSDIMSKLGVNPTTSDNGDGKQKKTDVFVGD